MGISAPGEDHGKITVRSVQLSTTPDVVQMNKGFSLEACEYCRFVQASGYSSMPDLSVLSMLCGKNYRDLYQSLKGEIFPSQSKSRTGRRSPQMLCFSHQSRRGAKGVTEVYDTGTDKPWKSFGKESFSDCMPALN